MKPTQEQVIAWAEEAGFYPGELRAGFNLFMGLASLAYEAGRKDENEAFEKVAQLYGYEPEKKLWLWKNFVDGRPEYWAFDNPYPTNLDNGDPQTLGQPCGYAIFKPSRDGSCGRTEEQVLREMKSVTAPPQQPEQEPVWCGCGDEIVADTGARCGTCVGIRDMRVWRGLSLEEFTAARRASQFRDVSESSCKKFYRAIEAKLREKNT